MNARWVSVERSRTRWVYPSRATVVERRHRGMTTRRRTSPTEVEGIGAASSSSSSRRHDESSRDPPPSITPMPPTLACCERGGGVRVRRVDGTPRRRGGKRGEIAQRPGDDDAKGILAHLHADHATQASHLVQHEVYHDAERDDPKRGRRQQHRRRGPRERNYGTRLIAMNDGTAGSYVETCKHNNAESCLLARSSPRSHPPLLDALLTPGSPPTIP